MTPLLAVKKLVKIPFQDFCHLNDWAARSENTPVFKLFTAGCDSILKQNRPLPSSRGSVIWYRNYGVKTRLSVLHVVLCCTSCALLNKLCFIVQVVLCCTNCALLYKLCFVVQIVLCCTNFALCYKLCFVVQVVLFCTSCAFFCTSFALSYKLCFALKL